MKFLRKLLLIFFDLIDELYHQKRIEKFIRKNNFRLNTFIDVGAFKGKYSDLILKIEKNCKIIMIEPQSKYFNFLKTKFANNNRVEVLRMAFSSKKTSLNLNTMSGKKRDGISLFGSQLRKEKKQCKDCIVNSIFP